MPPRAQPDEVIRKRFRALARALPRARAGAPRAVPKARGAPRPPREALPVALAAAPAKKRRKLRAKIQRITRRLGSTRELDVTLALIDELTAGQGAATEALGQLRSEVQAERRAQYDRMAGRLDQVDLKRLQARLEGLTGSPTGDGDDKRLPGTAALMLRLTRRAQELDEAVHAAGPLYAPEPIHAIRIAVKKLRYAFELARDLQLLGSRTVLPRLRAAQETLGRLHDLQVLGARVDAWRARMPPADPPIADLDALGAYIESECRELHARFLARRDRLVAVVDAALADVAARAAALSDAPAAPRPVVH
jgi:CHAD domain-containing protein